MDYSMNRMSDAPKPKPRFWPLLFLLAFVLGAILWGVWMSKVIRQTRNTRDERDQNGFFVPINTNQANSTNLFRPADVTPSTNAAPH